MILTASLFPRALVLFAMMLMMSNCCVRSFSRNLQRTRPFPTVAIGKWRLYSQLNSESAAETRKRIVFLGTPEVAATSLEKVFEASQQPASTFQVVGVVTQPPRRRKRKGKVEPSPVGKMAEELGLYIMSPEKANDPLFLEELEQQIKPDVCITAAYGQYLPKRFLAAPTFGTVNIHPSLLPRWRGASPVQRSLEAGDNPVGVTVLFTVSKMDAGPIIAQESVHIDADATASFVLPHLFDIGTQLLLKSLPRVLDGTITMDTAQAQDENLVVAADMIDSSEAELKVWEESALTCHNRLRGFSMWPGVFLYVQVGEREDIVKLKVTKSKVVVNATSEPTNVVRLGPNKEDGLHLVCWDGSILELIEVQPATKKPFPARDFQNGYPGEVIRWVRPPAAVGTETTD